MNDKTGNAPRGAPSVNQLDWLDPPLPCTGVYTEELEMVQHSERRVRYQDSPFGECTDQAHVVRPRHTGMQLVQCLLCYLAQTLHHAPSELKLLRTQCLVLWPQRLSACRRKCKGTWCDCWTLENSRDLHACWTHCFCVKEKYCNKVDYRFHSGCWKLGLNGLKTM